MMNTAGPLPSTEAEMTVICSYCGQLLQGKKLWHKERLSAREISLLPVSHGICADCLLEHFPNEYTAIKKEGHHVPLKVFEKYSH